MFSQLLFWPVTISSIQKQPHLGLPHPLRGRQPAMLLIGKLKVVHCSLSQVGRLTRRLDFPNHLVRFLSWSLVSCKTEPCCLKTVWMKHKSHVCTACPHLFECVMGSLLPLGSHQLLLQQMFSAWGTRMGHPQRLEPATQRLDLYLIWRLF